ncbi:194_t:CDS:2 [Ambispora leptoticha]|uniref:194_t:CDS:1 n=1 Tax=Ambispora leptoticha TaxID=144679 RepID=A0A9N9BY42_9GLOM|nr:194_t:CDS:2 [Ambispora leptoticha]
MLYGVRVISRLHMLFLDNEKESNESKSKEEFEVKENKIEIQAYLVF